MAKPKTLIFISYFILLVVSYPTQEKTIWCNTIATFPDGPCSVGGDQQCLLDFIEKYGAQSQPKNCICFPSESNSKERLCTCDIICQASPP
ncbi:hypothetical protein MANES_09G034200v8 [Manihot esculenta]|uniref:Bifunctional inhibitor/plant lipid transfer protein/seed storage helical domain-containing protein n=1 Tax=Manihot esculenta TaxID=3983 RepID=A0A2C9V7L9_MANES|nr:hypothetical protein MANES_09G034200v8 [Manihot esculenta]